MTRKLILFLTTISIWILCCNSVYCCKKHKETFTETATHKITLDSYVQHLLGDSVSETIFNADSIWLLKVATSVQSDSMSNDFIVSSDTALPDFHGCYIIQNLRTLSTTDIYPLLFILSDQTTYSSDKVRIMSPFMPYVALSFFKYNSRIDLVFSFSGGQIYIYDDRNKKQYFKYNYEFLILHFFQNYLNDTTLRNFLNINR